MKHFITFFIFLLFISSCSVYQRKSNTLPSSNRTAIETDCSELKESEYNGFYEPKEKGRVFVSVVYDTIEKLNFDKTPILSFAEIESIEKSFDNFTGEKVINIILTGTGRKIFKVYTADHIGEKLGIIFKDKLIMAPIINSEISGGKVQITNGNQIGIEELFSFLETAIDCRNKNN